MTQNRRWLLASHPQGDVAAEHFRIDTESLPDLDEGQFRVAVDYLAFDPAMRGWITGRDTYVSGIQVGDVMRGMAVGVVEASRNPAVAEGTRVVGMFGWQEYVIASSMRDFNMRPVPDGVPPTMPLSLLGITGLTAYFGLLDVGQPKEGNTILVSGAAGATGSVAAQIAKHVKGASKVVGVAGGPEKCAWLTDVARLDAAIDYKAHDARGLYREVARHFPQGIDVFFDNVGGGILDAALANIKVGARIVLCGAISRYNAVNPPPGPVNYTNLILKRGRMEGFIVMDYAARFKDASMELIQWAQAGHIAYQEDVQEGFEHAPDVFLRLFSGANRGKQLLKY